MDCGTHNGLGRWVAAGRTRPRLVLGHTTESSLRVLHLQSGLQVVLLLEEGFARRSTAELGSRNQLIVVVEVLFDQALETWNESRV